jgi:hypothetical protein
MAQDLGRDLPLSTQSNESTAPWQGILCVGASRELDILSERFGITIARPLLS